MICLIDNEGSSLSQNGLGVAKSTEKGSGFIQNEGGRKNGDEEEEFLINWG